MRPATGGWFERLTLTLGELRLSHQRPILRFQLTLPAQGGLRPAAGIGSTRWTIPWAPCANYSIGFPITWLTVGALRPAPDGRSGFRGRSQHQGGRVSRR